MASISHTKKKTWITPVVRQLSGVEADAARELLLKQFESQKKVSGGAR